MGDSKFESQSLDDYVDSLYKILKEQGMIDSSNQLKTLESYYTKSMHNIFCVEKSKYMTEFICEKVLPQQRFGLSKTYFVYDTMIEGCHKNTPVAFFSIKMTALNIENIPKKLRKKLILKGKSPNNITSIPCFLIEELAKNSLVPESSISGADILDSAIGFAKSIFNMVGGDLVILNALNVSGVLNVYSKYGFSEFNEVYALDTDTNLEFQPMYFKA